MEKQWKNNGKTMEKQWKNNGKTMEKQLFSIVSYCLRIEKINSKS